MSGRHFGLLICGLLLAAPTSVWGQADSVDSPNGPTCPPNTPVNVPGNTGFGKRMNVRVYPNNARKVDTSDIAGIPASACDTGPVIAKKGVDYLCLAARLDKDNNLIGDYTCTGFVDGISCFNSGPDDCCGPGYTETSTIDIFCRPVGGFGGFSLHRDGGTPEFSINRILPTKIQAVNQSTNAGNEYGPDLLPQYLTRVDPQEVNGVVSYAVYHTQGGQNPKNFDVNTTGMSDDAIHEAIRTRFEGLGLGLQANKHCGGNNARVHSYATEKFATGCFVRIPNAKGMGVTRILVKGQPGQDIISEQNVPGAHIPTLSPWGIGILGVLLLIGAWFFLHRRQVLVGT